MNKSAIFNHAAATWNEMKDDYDSYLEFAYMAADEQCNGFLLNKRGKAAGIDPWTLFSGSPLRARKYASEELIAHWSTYPRKTLVQFETEWFQGGRNAW